MTLAFGTASVTPLDSASLAQEWELTRMRRHRTDCGGPIDTGHGGAWILVTEGSAALRLGDERYVLDAGDAALLTTPTARSLVASAGTELAIGDLRSLVPVAGIRNPLIVRGFAARFPPVEQLVRMCPLSDSGAEPLWARAYANMIGAATLTAWIESSEGGSPDAAVTAVLAALTRAPGEAWSLDRMARIAHLSRSALAVRFRAVLGESPSDVLRDLRMSEARDLLAEQRLPIGAIASMVGYGSTAAFSRAFATQHGLAPQAWRDARTARSAARVPHQSETD